MIDLLLTLNYFVLAFCVGYSGITLILLSLPTESFFDKLVGYCLIVSTLVMIYIGDGT